MDTGGDIDDARYQCFGFDERGMAVILKNNSPRYALIDFSECDRFLEYRRNLIEKTADRVIEENLEAFQELAK